MPGTYAKQTDVPVSRSFDEVKRSLQRFGASAFGFEEHNYGKEIIVRFYINGIEVCMSMKMPDREDYADGSRGRRIDSAIDRDWEQACRQRWRTFANGVKAKLALVDDGISTVEREFLADIMTPSGITVGAMMLPKIKEFALPENTNADESTWVTVSD